MYPGAWNEASTLPIGVCSLCFVGPMAETVISVYGIKALLVSVSNHCMVTSVYTR